MLATTAIHVTSNPVLNEFRISTLRYNPGPVFPNHLHTKLQYISHQNQIRNPDVGIFFHSQSPVLTDRYWRRIYDSKTWWHATNAPFKRHIIHHKSLFTLEID